MDTVDLLSILYSLYTLSSGLCLLGSSNVNVEVGSALLTKDSVMGIFIINDFNQKR